MAKIALLDAIQAATEADLEQIDAEIATLDKRLAALRVARNVVHVQLHGAPLKVRRPAPAKREDADGESLATQIFDLIHAEGPLPANEIAQLLKRSPQSIGITCFKSGWFERLASGEWQIKTT